ncbi:hypothetical protein [Hymenobacter sp. BT190]|uniref:hypothetical protein n=1 Tax=Hymenobacter sp. BT190 TaxID=2763505 RepID=UPI0016514622|nr:hypothetical protein [Hymenobacter sp. BT190]MBC6698860.1 hypothetical protein [Hymenobacter sp. BT190]
MIVPLYESSIFSVSEDTSRRWLYIEWQGIQDETSALASCAIIMRFVKQTGVTKILWDSSQGIDGWELLGEWMQQHYFPRLWQNGIGAVAWVKAQEPTTPYKIQDKIQEFAHRNKHPVINIFDHLASACEWLEHYSSSTAKRQ